MRSDTRPQGVRGIVLAGGQGKRLRPLTYYFQKCMIPVGHSQKPLLEYIIRLLGYHGIGEITLLVGYKHNQITNYFNHGKRFHVDIQYVLDDPALKGTGGSLLNLYDRGLRTDDEDYLIYYGDILSNIDLADMLRQHRDTGAMATLALSRGYQVRVGVAGIQNDRVIGWTEKPRIDLTVGIGVLVLNRAAFATLNAMRDEHAELDIMSHLVPRLIAEQRAVHPYLTDAFWYDVGSTERYEKLDNGLITKYLSHVVAPSEPPTSTAGR